MESDQLDIFEPLLPLTKAPVRRICGLGPKGVARIVVLSGITVTAALLTKFLPVSKFLPCPYCHISSFIGWTYFLMWSVSFYPQLIINYRRKSVAGISLDFLALNVAGFSCYSVYNLALAFSPTVQAEYHERFGPINPVELNDIFFGLHALALSLVLAVQCLLYKRTPQQRVSTPTMLTLSTASVAGVGFAVYLGVAGERQAPFTWLDLCYVCSFFKMGVTLIKYIPQIHLNNTRQSTEGWSIDNVLLDLGGGLLSTGQLLVTCQVLHDYSPVLGNPIKFGLGLVSFGFDIVFILQHYVWYRGAPGPVLLSRQSSSAGAATADVSVVIAAGSDGKSDQALTT